MNYLTQRSRMSVAAAAAMTVLAAALLAGCGGGGSSEPVAPGNIAIISSQTTDTTLKYGPATLLVPAGNAPNGARLKLQSVDPSSSSLPANTSSIVVVDGTQTLLANSQASSSGLLTISISYDPAHLTEARGALAAHTDAAAQGAVAHTDATPEDSLRIATVVMQDGQPVWVANLLNNQVDKMGHVVSAQIPSTAGSGIYGLVMLAPPPPPATDF